MENQKYTKKREKTWKTPTQGRLHKKCQHEFSLWENAAKHLIFYPTLYSSFSLRFLRPSNEFEEARMLGWLDDMLL